jgi:hypothetical protein
MNKKVFIVFAFLGVCVLVTIGGVIFAMSQLKFEGKSEITTNGQTYVTYTGGTYYTELNGYIKQYFDTVNSIDLSKSNATQINSVAEQAKAALAKVETFMQGINKVEASGVPELNTAVANWIATERAVLSNQYPNLAQIMGESAQVESQAEADQANATIKEVESIGDTATNELNTALDNFYSANNK